MRLLIAEDEKNLNKILAQQLRDNGYSVDACFDGEDALDHIRMTDYDGVILDIMMPKLDGLEVLKKMRADRIDTPVLFLTARDSVADRVEGLDLGADDYLTKPFSIEEFLARIRVALRRSCMENDKAGEEASVYENGGLKIDYMAGCVYVKGEEIHLTPIEYKLLCLLAKNTGKVLTHNYILKEVWGSAQASDVPSLRVFMATLRKKVQKGGDSPQYIQTHIGVGYRMIRQ